MSDGPSRTTPARGDRHPDPSKLRALRSALGAGLGSAALAGLLVAALIATLARQVVARGQVPRLATVEDLGPWVEGWVVTGLLAALPLLLAIGLLAACLDGWLLRGRRLVTRLAVGVLVSVLATGAAVASLRQAGEDAGTDRLVLLAEPEVVDHDPAPAGGTVEPSAPHLVLITIDTQRFDRLGFAGYHRPTSPALDRFAARGTSFVQASAPAPNTTFSIASMMTGLEAYVVPMEHEDRARRGPFLSEGFETVAERLRAAGYVTAAFVSNPNLKRSNGFAQGFDHFDEQKGMFGPRRADRAIDAGDVVGAALEWLDTEYAPNGAPLFLWLHVLDPHHPYEPSEAGPWEQVESDSFRSFAQDYAQMSVAEMSRHLKRMKAWKKDAVAQPRPGEIEYLSDRYDSEVLQTDRWVGHFLDGFGRFLDPAETLVLLTADHGEEFFDHGGFLHSHTVYQELLHVPLVLAGPGVPAGRIVPSGVTAVDVAATLLRAAGLTPRSGRALQQQLEKSDRPQVGYSSTGLISLRQVDRKIHTVLPLDEPLCRSGDPRADLVRLFAARYGPKPPEDPPHPRQNRRQRRTKVFDLAADPGEQMPLNDPWTTHELLCELQRHLRDHPRPAVAEHSVGGLSDDDLESLRALGYVEEE